MHALCKISVWLVAVAAFTGGPAPAADTTEIGRQIAKAMVDIARHGNLHDVAYTRELLPLPFALARELSPQSSSSGAAIQYYQLTLTRAQRGTMTMTYLVASQGTLEPESSGTLTSYLSLTNLSEYACVTAEMLTSQFGPDDHPNRIGISLDEDTVILYRSDASEQALSYPHNVDQTGCLGHLGISQRNLPHAPWSMDEISRVDPDRLP